MAIAVLSLKAHQPFGFYVAISRYVGKKLSM